MKLVLAACVVAVAGLAIWLFFATRAAGQPPQIVVGAVRPARDAGDPANAVTPRRAADAAMAIVEPPERVAARDDRDALVATIIDSGAAREIWADQAEALFASIPGSRVGHGCYIAGCAATFTFPSETSYRSGIADVERGERYRAWTGGKRWSRPEIRDDGRVVVALILSRPD